MDIVLVVGRILFGLIFIMSGAMGHLGAFAQSRGYAQSKGIPLAGPAVILSGVGIFAGGLGVVLGVWADVAALGLALFLFFTAFFMHPFWTEKEPMARISELSQFQKDLALLGASLVVFAVTASGGDLGPSLTAPLLDLS